jgi:cyclic pyranopterin phosphate synthase
MISEIEDLAEISLTTNGFLLERDARALVEAGINRFNVSVDSLQQDRFYELTRRDALPRSGSSSSCRSTQTTPGHPSRC